MLSSKLIACGHQKTLDQDGYFSDRVLLTALGAVVVLFTIMSLVKVDLALAPRHERPVGWVAGVTGGIVGAMTTVGGPLFVMYLVGLGVERRVFLSALSLFFILSALLISGAFLAVGLFDATRLGLASVAFPSSLIGMWVRNWLGTRVPAHRFNTLILTVLGCLGANLLWRGISG